MLVYKHIDDLLKLKLTKQSHKNILCECSSQVSKKCSKIKTGEYRNFLKIMSNNNGFYKCLHCKSCERTGALNGNNKYDIPQDLFDNIDSEFKSYLLGWIISDGTIYKNSFSISQNIKDIDIIIKLRDLICKDIPIKTINGNPNMIKITINSKRIQERLLDLLKLSKYGKKSKTVNFPDIREDLKIHCIRGIFDGDGYIRDFRKRQHPECGIASSSDSIKNSIKEYINLNCNISPGSIRYSGDNCLEFLNKIYHSESYNKPWLSMDRKYYLHETWRCYVPAIGGSNYNVRQFPTFKALRVDKRAVLPSKLRVSDSGYDITIIDKYKDTYKNTALYRTGIKVQISHGYYLDMAPRSSIVKTGYILSNSLAIIDRGYIGEIYVALTKIDENMPDLEFPCKICQLIPRPIIHIPIEEVFSEDDLFKTSRADSGFGSSGN